MFYRKKYFRFALAADKDYSAETFIVPDAISKVNFVYQKSEKHNLERSTTLHYQIFQLMNATFGRYVYPTYSFVQGGDGGMEYECVP